MKNAPSNLERLAWRLETLAPNELVTTAGELIAQAPATLAGADAVLAVLESRVNPKVLPALAKSLAGGTSLPGLYVAGRLLAAAGEDGPALDCLSRAVAACPSPEPLALQHRARLLAKAKQFAAAGDDLRLALQSWPAFGFYTKCERLLEKIVASGQCRFRRACKLALIGSSTTALLATALRAAGFRDHIDLKLYEGAYGAYQQKILDGRSGLYDFKPDVVVILVNARDLALPPLGGQEAALDFARQLRALWATLKGRHPCHVIQVGLDSPAGGAWGCLEDLPTGRRAAIAAAKRLLIDDLPAGVSFLDPAALQPLTRERYFDEQEWLTSRQYPSSAALPLFADCLMAQVRAVLGLTSKVLVCDLDNTLWGGVIGEDGLGGIKIGPPSPAGEAYLALQTHLKELQQRGILLAVCSKNNPAEAELPFRQHDAMRLRLEDFVAFRANWQDKATNLQSMAEELSLGLDSFVFLDDNPLERSWVRGKLPQVLVPECGHDPLDMLAALRRGMYFEAISLTAEDMARHGSYKADAQRKQVAQAGGSLEDFLAGLDMAADHGPVDPANLARVTQLINKTNQFNLTTRRYSEEQVKAVSLSHDWWCRWFRLRDKFGDHGLIGVILAERADSLWRVDTFLMSCRVLGRQMEQFMSACLLSAAKSAGAKGVSGTYIPTAKNVLVKDLYPALGFAARDGEFFFDLSAKAIGPCPFIRDLAARNTGDSP